jgi:SPP1 family predicted phage head-tail adaptor
MAGSRAGKLRHVLQLQKPGAVEGDTVSQDTLGQPISVYDNVGNRWHGEVKPLQGRELEWARQISPDVTHKITIRYCRFLDPGNRKGGDALAKQVPAGWQWIYQGRTFAIQYVTCEDERRRWMMCLCIEKQAVA